MTNDEIIDKLIAICKAYHEALDVALAMLIESTRGVKYEPFYLSKSPMWPTIVAGKQLLDEIERTRRGASAPPGTCH